MKKHPNRGILAALAIILYLFTADLSAQNPNCDVTPPTLTVPGAVSVTGTCAGYLFTVPFNQITAWDEMTNPVVTATILRQNGTVVVSNLSETSAPVFLPPGQYTIKYSATDGPNITVKTQSLKVGTGPVSFWFVEHTGTITPGYDPLSNCIDSFIIHRPDLGGCASWKSITAKITGPGVKKTIKFTTLWGSVRSFAVTLPNLPNGGTYTVVFTGHSDQATNQPTQSASVDIPPTGEFGLVCPNSGILNFVPIRLVKTENSCQWWVDFSTIFEKITVTNNCSVAPCDATVKVANQYGNTVYEGPADDEIPAGLLGSVPFGAFNVTYVYMNDEQTKECGPYKLNVPKIPAQLNLSCPLGVEFSNDCNPVTYIHAVWDFISCSDKMEWIQAVRVNGNGGPAMVKIMNPTAGDTILNLGVMPPGTYTYAVIVGSLYGLRDECQVTFTVPPHVPVVNCTVSATWVQSGCGYIATLTTSPTAECCQCINSATFTLVGTPFSQTVIADNGGTFTATFPGLIQGTYPVKVTYQADGQNVDGCTSTFTLPPTVGSTLIASNVSATVTVTNCSPLVVINSPLLLDCGCSGTIKSSQFIVRLGNTVVVNSNFQNTIFPPVISLAGAEYVPGIYKATFAVIKQGVVTPLTYTLMFTIPPLNACCGAIPTIHCDSIPELIPLINCAPAQAVFTLASGIDSCIHYDVHIQDGGITVQDTTGQLSPVVTMVAEPEHWYHIIVKAISGTDTVVCEKYIFAYCPDQNSGGRPSRIGKLFDSLDVSVSPNPIDSNGAMQIVVHGGNDNCEFALLSATGQIITRQAGVMGTNEFILPGVPAGMYILRTQSGTQAIATKLIVVQR